MMLRAAPSRWGIPHGADLSRKYGIGPCVTGEPTVPWLSCRVVLNVADVCS